jgi:competence protein ComEA
VPAGPRLSRLELAAYAACAVLVVLLGWRVLQGERRAVDARSAPAAGAATAAGRGTGGRGAAGATVSAVPERGDGRSLVHVVGAVRRPGVYRLPAGARIQEAIRRAGGATSRADLQAINLAAKVADGQQVVVPRRASTASGGAAAAPAPGGAGATATAPAPGTPLSLNTATAEQLDTLDGVGPVTAQKILEYRSTHGGFSSIDDLAQIPGIGPKRLESLRAQVTL